MEDFCVIVSLAVGIFQKDQLTHLVRIFPFGFCHFSSYGWNWCVLTKTTGSWCFLLKKYLIVVNLSHISLSLNHSIKYVCCWQGNEGARKKLLPPMKTLLLLLTKSPNARKFCSSYCYLSFVRFFRFLILVYWDDYFKFAGFDSLKPLKKY